jgi:Secretion system C-terminal sorting domain
MKKYFYLIAFFSLLSSFQMKAQSTITTYYIIPPSNGCNGVWAVSNNMFLPCSGGTYSMMPIGCVQFTGSVSGDTAYWALCNFPCDVVFLDPNGGVCICGTGNVTGTENDAQQAIITTYPNPANTTDGWNIWFHQPGNTVTVQILNALGQTVAVQSQQSADQVYHIDTGNLSPGTYFVSVTINGFTTNEKLVITR